MDEIGHLLKFYGYNLEEIEKDAEEKAIAAYDSVHFLRHLYESFSSSERGHINAAVPIEHDIRLVKDLARRRAKKEVVERAKEDGLRIVSILARRLEPGVDLVEYVSGILGEPLMM